MTIGFSVFTDIASAIASAVATRREIID